MTGQRGYAIINPLMLKQKVKLKSFNKALRLLVVAGVLISVSIYGGFVRADDYDTQIRKLQNQNVKSQNKVDALFDQATSYQDAIDKLQQRIDSLQATIDKAQAQSDLLQGQIDKAKADLEHFKGLLGESIRTMYEEGQISTLEILASSNDLSDFVNKQQYRTAVQDKVKSTLDQINELKTTLEQKQRQLDSLIREKQQQQDELGAARTKQQKLLNYTSAQKASFETRINKNNSEIASLRAQQAAANQGHFGYSVSPGDPGHGGYPTRLDRAAQDSLIDPWGMYNRECVSYTAWKVQQTFGYMPYWGGHGNAAQWPGNARADGIPTGSRPRVHSVAIWPVGYYGHAMWVEAVYSNGNILVSQYNYDYQGHYSEMVISSSDLTFIYFR